MKEEILQRWRHQHSFGQDQKRPGEFRTFLVIAITASMMVVEIAAGIAFGSMALLADGLHMGSHAVALSINAFAYIYARRHAHNMRYSFGTGKVNTLGGYTGAILLAVFATMMAFESITRLIEPVAIAFNQAIFVAGIPPRQASIPYAVSIASQNRSKSKQSVNGTAHPELYAKGDEIEKNHLTTQGRNESPSSTAKHSRSM